MKVYIVHGLYEDDVGLIHEDRLKVCGSLREARDYPLNKVIYDYKKIVEQEV